MKKLFYILFLVPMMVFSQNDNLNYVKTETYIDPNGTQKRETITYFDGLGRPIQQIAGKASPNDKDIITHVEYDQYGRQAKEYLPYEATGNALQFDTESLLHTQQFYNTPEYENTTNPYNQQFFEASPLNRPSKKGAPGILWKGNTINNNDHTIKFDYQTNGENEVTRFIVNFPVDSEHPELVSSGYYAPNKLFKNITKDENWTSADGKSKTTEEFKDFEGKVILKRNYTRVPSEGNPSVMVDVAHDTYYVYDIYSNLTYVIPPLAVEKLSVSGSNAIASILNLCYEYHYDYRNRIIEKHIPDNGSTYIVYDKLDRPVLVQDEKMRAKTTPDHNWLFTSYDSLGRVAFTGSYYNASSYETIKQSYENATQVIFETRSAVPIVNDGMKIYYTNTGFAATPVTILTVNYYDDYDSNFDYKLYEAGFAGGVYMPTGSYYGEFTTKNRGLATGNVVRILGTDKCITTFTRYDERARPKWQWSYNEYSNTWNSEDFKVDFIGKTTATVSRNKTGSNDIVTHLDYFTYDNTDRPLKHTQYIGGNPQSPEEVLENPTRVYEMISWNKYDALGVVQQKKVGGKINGGVSYSAFNALQTVDYTQNIRGWLTDINNTSDDIGNTSDLFAFSIDYKDLYNGNISATSWKSVQNNYVKTYGYEYDALNRLTKAMYFPGDLTTENYTEGPIEYDKNGNITKLQRKGSTDSNSFGTIDILSYAYKPFSNQLSNVTDTSGSGKGFLDSFSSQGDDYDYDPSGNMKKDQNKGITSISYNHLNLPIEVKKDNDNKVEYVYDASGAKVQKKFTNGAGNITTTDYSYGYIFENNVLQYFSHPEGYVKKENGIFSYVYQYKDHLGNVRLSYSDLDKDGYINDVPAFYDGFENAAGWVVGYGDNPVSFDSTRKRTGNYSAKLTNSSLQAAYRQSEQWINIDNTVDTYYTYSGYVWLEGPDAAQLTIYMKKDGETLDYSLADSSFRSEYQGWHYITKTYLVPAYIKKLCLRIDIRGTGSAWFDDVSIKKTNGVSEIVDNNNYYPFGLQHKNNVTLSGGNDVAEKIKYNGKELQDELGLGWYDYQARNYDPAIGRWFNIDPLAETSRRYSPYTYALDNPVYFIDPDGKQADASIGYLSAGITQNVAIETTLAIGSGGLNNKEPENSNQSGKSSTKTVVKEDGDDKKSSAETNRIDKARAKTISKKEKEEQDNNYNFFYKTKDESLRTGAEYFDDGGANSTTIAVNAHGNKEYIVTPNGRTYPKDLHNYLYKNNSLYRSSVDEGIKITIRIEACKTGNGFAMEFSKFNANMTVIAPNNNIISLGGFYNYLKDDGKYLKFENGKQL